MIDPETTRLVLLWVPYHCWHPRLWSEIEDAVQRLRIPPVVPEFAC